jgi:hypothetical protein
MKRRSAPASVNLALCATSITDAAGWSEAQREPERRGARTMGTTATDTEATGRHSAANLQSCRRVIALCQRLPTNHSPLLPATRNTHSSRIARNLLKINDGAASYPQLKQGVRRNSFSSISAGTARRTFTSRPRRARTFGFARMVRRTFAAASAARQKLLRFSAAIPTMKGLHHVQWQRIQLKFLAACTASRLLLLLAPFCC